MAENIMILLLTCDYNFNDCLTDRPLYLRLFSVKETLKFIASQI